jgi:hypothetical protein
MRAEFFTRTDRIFTAVPDLQDALDAWVVEYNTARPHQSCGGRPPAERFRLADRSVSADDTAAAEPVPARPASPATRKRPAGVSPWVNAAGKISLAGFTYAVGATYAGEPVEVVVSGGLVDILHAGVVVATHAQRLREDQRTVHRATSSVLSWPAPSHASRKGITAARVCRWHQLRVAECDGPAVPLFGSRAGLNSCVMPSLRLGEAAGEFSDVPGADQLAHSGVITWRHCPVIAGRLAAPDPPPRVLVPEPVKFGIQAPPAWAGVHGRGRPAVDAASAPATSPGMTSPGNSGRRGPECQICHAATSLVQRPRDSGEPRVRGTPGASGLLRPLAR